MATQLGGPKWRLFLVDQNGDSFWRTKMAGLLGSSIWGLRRAGQFGIIQTLCILYIIITLNTFVSFRHFIPTTTSFLYSELGYVLDMKKATIFLILQIGYLYNFYRNEQYILSYHCLILSIYSRFSRTAYVDFLWAAIWNKCHNEVPSLLSVVLPCTATAASAGSI